MLQDHAPRHVVGSRTYHAPFTKGEVQTLQAPNNKKDTTKEDFATKKFEVRGYPTFMSLLPRRLHQGKLRPARPPLPQSDPSAD